MTAIRKNQKLNGYLMEKEGFAYHFLREFDWKLTTKEFADLCFFADLLYYTVNEHRLSNFDYIMTPEGLKINGLSVERETLLKSICNHPLPILNSNQRKIIDQIVKSYKERVTPTIESLINDCIYGFDTIFPSVSKMKAFVNSIIKSGDPQLLNIHVALSEIFRHGNRFNEALTLFNWFY